MTTTQTGTLYLIPNSLGALDAPDAAHILAQVLPVAVQQQAARLTHYVAENAKTTRAFLKHINSFAPLAVPLQQIAISELNIKTPANRVPELLAPLRAGHDVGLISEAGVPAVADPGALLVRHAHAAGIAVRPLVGPSSLLLALMASGLNGQSFAFHGYLPVEAAERSQKIRSLEASSRSAQQTQILIETPYRNAQMLKALAESCHPETLICAATDLSLSSEQIRTQSAQTWRKQAAQYGETLQKRPTVFLLLAGA